MAQCLFLPEEELTNATKEEHVIPESIEGRIKTREGTSSKFNAFWMSYYGSIKI